MKLSLLVISCQLLALAAAVPFWKAADDCSDDVCKIENNCRCSGKGNPITDPSDPAPQLLAITISESVVTTVYNDYLKPLFFDNYFNPDGESIGLTLYVNHEYTDYSLVQNLYNYGFEIGVHSVTKNFLQEYWRDNATAEELVQEFSDQRKIISKYANIPIDDIKGARTPQLQIRNDTTFNAYEAAGLSYDNSWPTSVNEMELPYTLDYRSSQKCLVSVSCPVDSHPGFWVAPITDIQGPNDSTECNSLATCGENGTSKEISDWLLGEVDRYRKNGRGPMILRLDSYWFNSTENALEGFHLFLEEVTSLGDVFVVKVSDILDWIKNPVPLSQYTTPYTPRDQGCKKITCNYEHPLTGLPMHMVSCVACPRNFPWLGNPDGN